MDVDLENLKAFYARTIEGKPERPDLAVFFQNDIEKFVRQDEEYDGSIYWSGDFTGDFWPADFDTDWAPSDKKDNTERQA